MQGIYETLCIISVVVTFAGIVAASVVKDMKGQRYLLLSMLSYTIAAVSMFFEINITTVETAATLQKMQYIGSGLAAAFALFYFYEFCEIKVSKIIVAEVITANTAIMFFILTNDYIHLFGSNYSLADDGVYLHLTFEKGTFFYIYLAQVLLEVVVAVLCTMKYCRRHITKDDTEPIVATFGTSVPCLIKVLYICGAFGNYDPTPVSAAFAAICMIVCVMLHNASGNALKGKEFYIDGMREGFLLIDRNKAFISANEKAKSLFPYISFMKPGTRIDKCEDELLRRAVDGEITEASINDRFYEFRITPIEEKKGIVGWIVVTIDVTEAHNDFIKMTELKEKAESAAKAKEVFLANMSHEIRTPMNAIVGMASLLLESPDLKGNDLDCAKTIQMSSETLLGIINDVLDFSKVESGKMEILNDEYSLSGTLHDVYSILQIKMQEKGLEYRLSVDDNVPDKLFGDVIRLRQILLNLLNNAVKFTKKGFISVNVAWNDVTHNHGKLLIAVEDTGMGIKKEDYDKLFVDFSRLDTRNNASTEGSGLGLSICQRLLKLMDGSINVESIYGVGSTFSFVIPQDAIGEEKCLEVMNERKKKKQSRPGVQTIDALGAIIMVVDDNEVNLKVSGGLLTAMKATVILKNSGAAAIEYIERGVKLPDIILMDHMMPGMDGLEATNRIRNIGEYGKSVKIIALTANAVNGVKNLFMENGFDGYVSKPIDLHTLGAYILKFLPNRKSALERAVANVHELSYSDAMKICGSESRYIEALLGFCATVEHSVERLNEAVENKQKSLYKSEINGLLKYAEEIGNKRMLNMGKALEEASGEDMDFIVMNTPVFTNFLLLQRDIIKKEIEKM